MAETEGVIRYRLDYRQGRLPSAVDLGGLFRWFERCSKEGLIGSDPGRYDGFAYGNISIRVERGFVVSGTQTGGKSQLTAADLAWVEDFSPEGNWLRATGPTRPSSEAMTHGQIYWAQPAAGAVIHVHSAMIWRHAQALEIPVTAAEAGYGTPEMAAEVRRLLDSTSGPGGIFAMGGHEAGVVAYAGNLDDAGSQMMTLLARARRL